ncbi:MAG: LacI family DNA-binding transcriptional regulator [Planctomycetota bacterium]|jgi:LacI family transcriptional regulator
MSASIEDVAKRADVSISTVSRVINRRDVVNEKTRRRVEDAIKELNYRPNMFARGLMLQKSELLGLVLPDLHGEFYSEIIRGANAKARELKYVLVIASSHNPDDARTLVEDLQTRSITDGVAVMVSDRTAHIAKLLPEFQVPIVVVDGAVENRQYDQVVIDQRAGAMAMMRHLIDECRCRRILFVGGLETNVDTIARLDAYKEALGQADLPVIPEDIYHLDYEYETAYQFAVEHVREWTGRGYCVFAANDEMASGIIDAATANGVEVPADLAVVGFDDTRVARMTRPPLTTVHVPMSQLGATAMELLCQRLADMQRSPAFVSLSPQLVVRESCGAKLRC